MSNSTIDSKRRRTLMGGLAVITAIPLSRIIQLSRAEAADLPHLAEDDATAKALNYKHDAAAAPRTDKAGTAAAEQYCHNCMFIQANDGEWVPCQLFPGKLVNANGWCSSWMPKSG